MSEDRSLIGAIAANERWARLDPEQRRAATEAARAARIRRYEDQVDPERQLDPIERARRVSNLVQAEMARLTRASIAARRKRAGLDLVDQVAELDAAGEDVA